MADAVISVKNGDAVPYMKGGAVPEVTVIWDGKVLVQGTDYTVKYASNKAVTGTNTTKLPTVTVTGKGNFTGTGVQTFTIVTKDINEMLVLAPDTPFVGQANKYQTKVTLTDKDGKNLVAGTDYEKELKYYCNGEELGKTSGPYPVGTIITVKVTGKGAYTGEVSKDYKIISTEDNISKATVKISNQEWTGERVVLDADDIRITIGKEKTVLVLGKDYEIIEDSYINNMNKGTAKVTIRGINGYGGCKTVSFKIVQRNLTHWWNKIFI